jgi:plastocyanin
MRRRAAALSALVLIASAAAIPASAGVIHVEMKGIGFAPLKVSARVGDTVEWNNRDFVAHTATARGGSWDINLPPGKSGRAVMSKAGRLAYYCRFHPNMTAEIDVAPK